MSRKFIDVNASTLGNTQRSVHEFIKNEFSKGRFIFKFRVLSRSNFNNPTFRFYLAQDEYSIIESIEEQMSLSESVFRMLADL